MTLFEFIKTACSSVHLHGNIRLKIKHVRAKKRIGEITTLMETPPSPAKDCCEAVAPTTCQRVSFSFMSTLIPPSEAQRSSPCACLDFIAILGVVCSPPLSLLFLPVVVRSAWYSSK
ncbi:hypothetical protein PIB30_039929 [Stylosanthes scabra]|uniref:Uncharacterized protein n=1 Tax=Stylosanthes scabra TaxID=79078 RepID=A0ABU6RF17_9FABA|nr:hypothetical protein [Stylosanthes scabra]